MNRYYVYIHTRNDTGAVFYVGKGKEYRCSDHGNRNAWWTRIANKHGFTPKVLEHFELESDAFSMERYLIASYKSCGVSLTNQTDGGEGMSGYVHTQGSKQAIADKMRVIKTGIARPPGVIEKMAIANRTRVRPPEELELRRKAMVGNTNGRHLAGVPKSDIAKRNMKLAWVKRKASRKD